MYQIVDNPIIISIQLAQEIGNEQKNEGSVFLCNEPNFDSQVTQTPMSTSLNQWFSRQWKRCEDTWRVKLEGTCWDQKARLKTEIFELKHVCFLSGGLEPNKFYTHVL